MQIGLLLQGFVAELDALPVIADLHCIYVIEGEFECNGVGLSASFSLLHAFSPIQVRGPGRMRGVP